VIGAATPVRPPIRSLAPFGDGVRRFTRAVLLPAAAVADLAQQAKAADANNVRGEVEAACEGSELGRGQGCMACVLVA
jgi:hypothetical protein